MCFPECGSAPYIREKNRKGEKCDYPKMFIIEPETVDQALYLLASHKDDAKVLAGGTDLLVRMKKGLLKPRCHHSRRMRIIFH